MTMYERSVGMLEREAEMRRRRLSSTLDELTDKLTPGGVLDEIMSYTRAGGGDFLKGLGKSAAANPIPTLLIGVGCAMFLSGRTGLNGENREGRGTTDGILASVGRAIGSVTNALGEGAGAAVTGVRATTGAVGSIASSIAGSVSDGASTVGQAASGLASRAGEAAAAGSEKASKAVHDAAQAAGDYAGSAVSGVHDTAGVAADRAGRISGELAANATKLTREQPLLVAAAGLALGAVVAALLPRTQVEDSLMGETSDAVKRTVGHAAADGIDAAADAVGRVTEEVARTVGAEGISSQALAEGVHKLGEKVSKVAEAGINAAKDESEKAFRHTDRQRS